MASFQFWTLPGVLKIWVPSIKDILEFWRLLYSISRVHWASIYNLCAPWDIYRSLNPLFWWWKGAMMAYQLTLVLVFYFFMPTYIYLNVNICSMHICTRGPQMSWIQKKQFHFSKSNFLVPKIFDFKMKISVIPHLSSIFGTMAHNLCSNSNV